MRCRMLDLLILNQLLTMDLAISMDLHSLNCLNRLQAGTDFTEVRPQTLINNQLQLSLDTAYA